MTTLSKNDANFLLDLIHESLSCNSRESFTSLIGKFDTLIPYKYNTCVFRWKETSTGKESYEVLNINYPEQWLDLYISKKFNLVDPIIKKNFMDFELQYWSDTYKKHPPPREFKVMAESFGLTKGYTFGARNTTGTESSLFSFSGPDMEPGRRSELILKHFVPHLHQVFTRIARPCKNPQKTCRISPREKEVLKWVSQGKSSWDVSMILNISERTVNFHVNSIMQKLGAVSRSHAVATALELGLIDID